MGSDSNSLPLFSGQIETTWKWARLDSLAEVIDCPHSTPVLTDYGPYIARSQDIRSGVFQTESAGRVSEETYAERIRRAEPRFGDLLYSREGTYFGIAAAVPRHTRLCLGQRMVLIRPNQSIESDFLRYWLNSPHMSRHILGFRDGSVAERLNLPTIRALHVAFPKPPEQSLIAGYLSSLDDKIALLRETNITLEAVAQAIFKSWFVDFAPVRAKAKGRDPEGVPSEVADLFPSEFEDSALGEIPKGWRVGTLGEISTNVRSQARPEEFSDEIPYIGLEHMPRNSIALGEWETASKVDSAKSRFRKGQILFGKLRPYFHKVGIAPLDGVCSTDILVIEPRSPGNRAFCVCHFSSTKLVDYATQLSNGAKMPRTNWQDLARYGIPIPPLGVASAFNRIVDPLIGRIVESTHHVRALGELRDTLLPRLMSGKLHVLEEAPMGVHQ